MVSRCSWRQGYRGISTTMAGNFEVAVKIENHKCNFLGSHIVIDLAAAKWT